MVPFNIVLVEIIIQGKAEFGHWTVRRKTFEPCQGDTVLGEAAHTNRWIFLNIPYVIKDEGAIEGV